MLNYFKYFDAKKYIFATSEKYNANSTFFYDKVISVTLFRQLRRFLFGIFLQFNVEPHNHLIKHILYICIKLMIYCNLFMRMQHIRGSAMIHVVHNTHKPPYLYLICTNKL